MPNLSLPPRGADENNRFGIIKLLQRQGYAITIIAKALNLDVDIQELETRFNVKIKLSPYKPSDSKTPKYYLKRLMNPLRWDGAADEYFDKTMWAIIKKEADMHTFDAVVIEYTFVWPVIYALKKYKGPIIIRSHNFEPLHFLSEDGISPLKIVKFFAKLLTEYKAGRVATTLLAITPKEANRYKSIRARNVLTLYSGYLPLLLERPPYVVCEHGAPLKLLFMGASYNIPHNKKAATFLIQELMPLMDLIAPGAFKLYISGGKLPQHLISKAHPSVKYVGYVDDIENLLQNIDAVVVPHLAGHGMQLKLFEPLVRGIPIVTTKSLLGGYPFKDQGAVITAQSLKEYGSALMNLQNSDTRRKLSRTARQMSEELFNSQNATAILAQALDYP